MKAEKNTYIEKYKFEKLSLEAIRSTLLATLYCSDALNLFSVKEHGVSIKEEIDSIYLKTILVSLMSVSSMVGFGFKYASQKDSEGCKCAYKKRLESAKIISSGVNVVSSLGLLSTLIMYRMFVFDAPVFSNATNLTSAYRFIGNSTQKLVLEHSLEKFVDSFSMGVSALSAIKGLSLGLYEVMERLLNWRDVKGDDGRYKAELAYLIGSVISFVFYLSAVSFTLAANSDDWGPSAFICSLQILRLVLSCGTLGSACMKEKCSSVRGLFSERMPFNCEEGIALSEQDSASMLYA